MGIIQGRVWCGWLLFKLGSPKLHLAVCMGEHMEKGGDEIYCENVLLNSH